MPVNATAARPSAAAEEDEHQQQQQQHLVMEDNDDDQQEEEEEYEDEEGEEEEWIAESSSWSTALWTGCKLLTAVVLCISAVQRYQRSTAMASSYSSTYDETAAAAASLHGRRLSTAAATTTGGDSSSSAAAANTSGKSLPAAAASLPIQKHLQTLYEDLWAREKLFDETPPEEVKYWFEYTGPLQKYYYRFSRSRGKADYFEGRDDSGVVSARFVSEPGGTSEYQRFYSAPNAAEETARARFLSYCMALGSATRPKTGQGTAWNDWWGRSGSSTNNKNATPAADRCRILFTINTVGAGRGSTLLWETQPPLVHAEGPAVWTSEQETAATHLQRNFAEINHLCETGLVAARVQVLVCEPIAPQWTDWMDSLLPACGGKPLPPHQRKLGEAEPPASTVLEDRPSPVQIVVSATAATADTCHDLKSGFMEKRMQDLILAPPFLQDASNKNIQKDPHVKYTHPDLVSSEPHDVYVGLKWSSLVTMRAVSAFVQASADLAAAAAAPASVTTDTTALSMTTPSSPFLIPSFVRVSYVSEENSKVAKWRMHGDFFHPAAWEICKDSFDTTWIPHSLASSSTSTAIASHCSSTGSDTEACGQWWVYMRELQMPTSPEVYANEVTPALVQGGSNFIYMLTERHRQEIVASLVCRHENKVANTCPPLPQAVIPLGDLESFLINFTPNTALGKEHVPDRRPGYSKAAERQADRERVQKRKQLHDQEEIEHALFDYTIYPAALFHKDATLKAARARDAVLTPGPLSVAGPQTCRSSYYDVTITKPRPPALGWCQMLARKGLCTLYADYVRSSSAPCRESCGMSLNWTPATPAAAVS